jgi:hypothetical protein
MLSNKFIFVLATIFIIVSLALSITSIVLSTTDSKNRNTIQDTNKNENNSANNDSDVNINMKEKEGNLIRSLNKNSAFNLENLQKSKHTTISLKSKPVESLANIVFVSNLLEYYGIENYLTHNYVSDQNKLEFSEKDNEIGFTVQTRDFDRIVFEIRDELETKYKFTCSHVFPKTKQFFKDLPPTHRNAHYSNYAEFYTSDQLKLRFYFVDKLQACTKLPDINVHIPQQYQSWII